MVSREDIMARFQEVCVGGSGFIGLLFGEPNKKEVCSVKIIGVNDDPDKWLAVVQDVGRGCLALFELDELHNLSFIGVNLLIFECICGRIANQAIISGGALAPDWGKSLTKAEIALVNIMEKRGVMAGISRKVLQAGLLAARSAEELTSFENPGRA